jgi:phosphatidate cytidylyltransferase
MKFSNLGKRLFFALWAVPLGWWVINTDVAILPASVSTMSILPAHILVIILIMISCFEYTRMMALHYHVNAFWLSYVWLGIQFVLYFINDTSLPSSLSIYGLLILVAFEAMLWGRKNKRSRWMRASMLFSGNAFLYIAAVSMFNLYREPFQNLYVPNTNQMLSQLGIVTVFAAIFMCDSMAYFTGSLWGKHHFSTISPKKTIEGSIGGLIAAVLVCSISWYHLAVPVYPRWLGILLGINIGVFAQTGDLLVSLIKRYFRVKDASDIIPGHGGILDRFDSVFFTIPMIVIFTWMITKIYG